MASMPGDDDDVQQAGGYSGAYTVGYSYPQSVAYDLSEAVSGVAKADASNIQEVACTGSLGDPFQKRAFLMVLSVAFPCISTPSR